jgi:hypothetical protein
MKSASRWFRYTDLQMLFAEDQMHLWPFSQTTSFLNGTAHQLFPLIFDGNVIILNLRVS